jgi:hypothetical protein
MKSKVTEAKIGTLIPDNLNANKHSEFGMQLLEKSISELGLGRSIVIDKNNRIIGGNAVVETASALGLENVIIVPTDGKQLVVVKREDVDLDTKRGRELALADNSTSRANLIWDEDVILAIQEQWEVKPEDWGTSTGEFTPPSNLQTGGSEGPKSDLLIVESNDPDRLNDLFFELKDRGFMVQLKKPKNDD